MRLYHSPGTRSTRALWTLEEIGEPYDLTLLTKEERQGDAHRAVHPLGRVPALDDGAGPILESSAICLHLADAYPGAGLQFPLGSHERALVYQWAFFGMIELENPIVDFWIAGDADPEKAAAAQARFDAACAVVDNALAGGDHIVGGRFSVADIVLVGVLGFANYLGMLGSFPRLVAYVKAHDERPARQRAQAIGQ
jgi:glutathione S-transferase